MNQIDPTQVSAIVIIVLFLIKEVFSFAKNKRNDGTQLLKNLRENDLKEISNKLEKIDDKIDEKFEKIITLLTEIKAKIK